MKLIIVILLCALVSCNNNTVKEDTAQKESALKVAMQKKLYQDVNNDSTAIKFQVQDVIFFEEKEYFVCEFKVRLQKSNIDTTGTMTAEISKDMQVVKRKS